MYGKKIKEKKEKKNYMCMSVNVIVCRDATLDNYIRTVMYVPVSFYCVDWCGLGYLIV